ncbi:hypothetical protein [Agrobacterium vitis]|uniref:hypothetical protein n=1 Tax=Agrobacterium vitis TaxID=373 RepID=UPI0012E935CD|nr:hypothetical protein [Agrobacterium vitis]MUZ64118.1 hypothetical protein [Agrobacterium vitis]
MKDFLKRTPQQTSPASGGHCAPQKISLNFAELEHEAPELWVRVVITRNRVKRLSYNFNRDANKALNRFYVITGGTAALIILSLSAVVRLMPTGMEGNNVLTVTVVIAGTVAAVLASAANALGAGKRASSLFAAKWSMRALELNIDQTVHLIAIKSGNGKITSSLEAELDTEIEAWLAAVTQTLNAFGSEYGKALGTVTVTQSKLIGIK